MLRGSSLAPRRGKPYSNIPRELKYSLFEYPIEEEDGTTRVRVFDNDGNLTTRQVGVHSYKFRSVAMFYMLRAQPWMTLLSLSILFYLGILLVLSIIYYAWGAACGAHVGTTPIVSLYFTVVSLAANGGYMGEDQSMMVDPNHLCYTGRTLIVMACSYANIVFVGLVAALVVGKAEYTGKLGTRIVFSDFCALSVVPGKVDEWKLTFRIANMENMKALVHGQLRLFCMTVEPLKEYRKRKREIQLRRHRVRAIEQQRREALIQPLTMELLKNKAEGGGGAEFTNASFTACDPTVRALLRFKADRKRKLAAEKQRHSHKRKVRASPGTASSPLDKDKAPLPSRRSQPNVSVSIDSATAADGGAGDGGSGRKRRRRKSHAKEEDKQGGESGRSGPNGNEKSRNSSANSSNSSSPSSDSGESTRSSSTDVYSHKTNSTYTNDNMSPANSFLSPAGPSPNTNKPHSYGTMGKDGNKKSQYFRSKEDPYDSDDYEDEEASLERVRVRVKELRWKCAEETYLERDNHQISLWYPIAITHTINERSPLYRFMEAPRVGAALTAEDLIGSFAGNKQWKEAADSSVNAGSKFQLIAEFDATEMETGAVITAKHTYTTTDIMTHYKFSSKLVHMKADSHEIMLDYHYFNEMLPVMAVESSTTDSEA